MVIVNIKQFLDCNAEEKNRLGKNARTFYETYFNEALFMDKLVDCLTKTVILT